MWVSLFVGVALWFYTRGSVVGTGIALSIPVVLVKFLALVTVPPFFPKNSRSARFVASFAVLPALVYGFLILHHIDILVPVRNESEARTSGNVPFLLTAWLEHLHREVPTHVFDGVALLALAALALWIVSRGLAAPRLCCGRSIC